MAINNPSIVNYQGLYFQRQSPTAASAASEVLATYSLIPLVSPKFKMPQPKEPYNIDWKDEHGADEYTDHLFYEAFEIEIQFYIRATTVAEIEAARRTFFNAFKEGEFMVYSEYWGNGYQHVRFAGESEETDNVYNGPGNISRQFAVKFRVNDPISTVSLNNGVLSVAE